MVNQEFKLVKLQFDPSDLTDYSDKVKLNSNYYKKIFGKPYSADHYEPSKRGILKIRNGRLKIYRMFVGGGIPSGKIQLTFESLNMLGVNNDNNIDKAELIVARCNKFWFYWNHPLHEVRINYKMWVISYGLGVVLFCLSIAIAKGWL